MLNEEQVRAIVREELQRHEQARSVNVSVTTARIADATIEQLGVELLRRQARL